MQEGGVGGGGRKWSGGLEKGSILTEVDCYVHNFTCAEHKKRLRHNAAWCYLRLGAFSAAFPSALSIWRTVFGAIGTDFLVQKPGNTFFLVLVQRVLNTSWSSCKAGATETAVTALEPTFSNICCHFLSCVFFCLCVQNFAKGETKKVQQTGASRAADSSTGQSSCWRHFGGLDRANGRITGRLRPQSLRQLGPPGSQRT